MGGLWVVGCALAYIIDELSHGGGGHGDLGIYMSVYAGDLAYLSDATKQEREQFACAMLTFFLSHMYSNLLIIAQLPTFLYIFTLMKTI